MGIEWVGWLEIVQKDCSLLVKDWTQAHMMSWMENIPPSF